MSLVFYYAPMSTATMTHWALEELGIPYEKVRLDLKAGDAKKPAFLKLNPNAKVPVVVHDGVPVFESAAIAIHLGETFGVEKKLFPPAGAARGEALKWIVWTNVSLGQALAVYQHASDPHFPAERHNAKTAEHGRAWVESLIGILDDALAGKTWLVGDAFSLVDCHVACMIEYLGFCGFDPKRWKNVGAWLTRATARPAHDRAGAA